MFRQFIEHSNSSPSKAVIAQSVSCRPMLTCNTSQDLPLRSEYVHVIGEKRLGTNF